MPVTINGNGTITGLAAGGISNTKAIASAALPAGAALQIQKQINIIKQLVVQQFIPSLD